MELIPPLATCSLPSTLTCKDLALIEALDAASFSQVIAARNNLVKLQSGCEYKNLTASLSCLSFHEKVDHATDPLRSVLDISLVTT